MRTKNVRLVWTGLGLAVLAALFFVGMLELMAPKSNNPTEMMRTVGQVSGALVAIGLIMAGLGMIGRKT